MAVKELSLVDRVLKLADDCRLLEWTDGQAELLSIARELDDKMKVLRLVEIRSAHARIVANQIVGFIGELPSETQ